MAKNLEEAKKKQEELSALKKKKKAETCEWSCCHFGKGQSGRKAAEEAKAMLEMKRNGPMHLLLQLLKLIKRSIVLTRDLRESVKTSGLLVKVWPE